ncbi:MAG: 16S rRNA processing protein RimM [Armatimonadetes bacterium]|nr:16S rRNA processing protein RimM [Armatimonadota bacterium]
MSTGYVVRGTLGPPHGVRGEVKVRLETDYPERVCGTRRWLLRDPDGNTEEVDVERVREHQGLLLAKLRGVDGRDAAKLFRGREIICWFRDLPPLPEGEYYHFQLVGLQVVTVDGRPVGRIKEILRTGSNDVYVTEGPLIPALEEVIEKVDLEGGVMVIRPMKGLLD